MSNRAWVTLATNDSYGLGALVLAHSLRRAGSTYPAVVLITPSVTEAMRERLRAVFTELINVDVLDSRDATHLALLQRPELGITFTKIHCWSLTQFEKCVFLDADTLIVQNCDELFEREELSAAPDVGWPDCFNSGVFVFTPSADTYTRLISFAQERGSFDGGDQGLLNAFFSDWARGDTNKRLPFLYNVTSAAFYSYLPALKHYGQNLKIIHFIGSAKPWLQQYNWQSQSVDAPEHLREFLQLWWDLFVTEVHQQLDTAMESTIEVEVATPELSEYPEDTVYHYEPILDPVSEFPWHRPEAQNQESIKQQHQIDVSQCHDPWMYHRGNIPPNTENFISHQSIFEGQHEINKVLSEYRSPQQVYNSNYFQANEQNIWHQSNHHSQHNHSDHQHSEHQWENSFHSQKDTHDTHAYSSYLSKQLWFYGNQSDSDNTNHSHNDSSLHSNSQEHTHSHHYHNENISPSYFQELPSHDSQSIQNHEQNAYTHYINANPESHIASGDDTQTQFDTRDNEEHKSWVLHRSPEPPPQQEYQLHVDRRNRNQRRRRVYRLHLPTPASGLTNGHCTDTDSEEDYIIPRHPYDGFYLMHRPTIDAHGRKICVHEIPPTPSPSPLPESLPSLESVSVHSEDYHTASECEEQSGVAGNLARVVPGDVGYQREAIDELSRRQGWEAGNIDYMGADSFDNIWAKISQTLNQPRTSPPKQPSPPRKEPSPPKALDTPTGTEPVLGVTAAPVALETPAPAAAETTVSTATETPTSVAVETPAPVATETPGPAAAETPVAAAAETPVLAAAGTPAPAATESPAPAAAETSAPALVETSALVAETPVPVAAETPVPAAAEAPAAAETPASAVPESPAPAAAETPAPAAVESPALAAVESPAPAAVETTAPVAAETPVPITAETSAPSAVEIKLPTPGETLVPAVAEIPVSAAVESPVLAAAETPAPSSVETPVPAAAETPAPAETPAAVESPVTSAVETAVPVTTETPASALVQAPAPVETTPVQAETPVREQVVLQQESVALTGPTALVEPAATEAAAAIVEPPKLEPVATPAHTEIPKTIEQDIATEKTEPVVSPTPPATPKSTPDVSPTVLETPPNIETTSEAQSGPVEAPKAAEPSPAVAESPAPAADAPGSPEAPTAAQLTATPEKPSETSVTSTDSPPLANTPSKEEAPAAPAAKSEERRKPAGKLQLSPPAAADPLPTPDSEVEDAAALAHAIIASELSATVTAPSPADDPASPPPPKEDKKLSVGDPEVPTPPVSLEQIGVKSKGKSTTASQIESSIAEKAEPVEPAPTPTTPTTPTTPSTPSTPTAEAPKKKVVKKTTKKEAGPSGDVPSPVPPPRKKEKKPKEK